MELDQYIKRTIIKILPAGVKHEITAPYRKGNLSYAQEGEDMILQRLFERIKEGFYVDVGAHHPIRFSNTFHFYQKGWRGINIDAMPGSMRLFDEIRPRDTNLEIPISDVKQTLIYYTFNEPALNTFSEEEMKLKDGQNSYFVTGKLSLQTERLADVLDEYLPDEQSIDFMSIDVEGLDFQVLQSNNWEKYRPEFVLVESLRGTIDSIVSSPMVSYMRRQGYEFYAKTVNTLFFKNG